VSAERIVSVFKENVSELELEKLEPKHIFIFNESRFRTDHCTDDTELQNFVSFARVFNDKSVYKLTISSSSSLTYSLITE
jgi:hypothetical protein